MCSKVSMLHEKSKNICVQGIQNKKYRLASYLMEHIYFEARLWTKILISKENSKSYISITLP